VLPITFNSGFLFERCFFEHRNPISLKELQPMLAHRLKQARLKANLSQEKLGKLAGIDPMSASARMNQYERGKHAPDYQLMCKVSEILTMPVSWFYTQDEDAAKLQEIFFNLSTDNRKSILATAEALFAQTAPVAAGE
jgi:transcriptional regulator with XRE-family HTH domain